MPSIQDDSARTSTTSSGLSRDASAGTPSILSLFLAFLRLGATSFGGPSMVAYIRRLAVEKRRWLEESAFLEGVALCQVIPGATAMQTAAYVGFRARGLAGAAATFIGFGFPAFVLMMIFAGVYSQSHAVPAVVSAFKGLQAVIVAIVANATVSFGRTTLTEWKGTLAAVAAAILFRCGVNPIIVIAVAMILGLALRIRLGALRSGSGFADGCSKRTLVILLGAVAVGSGLLFIFSGRLFKLAALMSIIDLTAFGGGFASIPLMYHEVVDVYKWLDGPTFLNGIVLGQITPGPIVITATFIGYLSQGPLAGIAATIGVFLPSFLLVILTAPYFSRLLEWPLFIPATGGILCSFVGLLLTVTLRFSSNVQWDLARVLLAAAAFLCLQLKVDILWVVLAGAAVSVAFL